MNITAQGISPVDWIVLFFYSIMLVAIALYHSRKMRGQEDYFLAGRFMSKWPIALSMYMAIFSTNSFIGITGWVNRPTGTVWIGLQSLGVILAVPLVIMLYPSIFFRLRITTAYEYLEKRFNYRARAFAAVFFLCARIMWMSTMLYAASLILSLMLGWTATQGDPRGEFRAIFVVAFLGIFLAFSGGMLAVIWTDVFQFFVLFGGVVGMSILAVTKSGGISQVAQIAIQSNKLHPPQFFSITDDLSIVSGLCLGFIAYLSSSGADQIVLQTYMSAKSEIEAKKSLIRNAVFLKPMSLVFPLLGLLIFAYYQTHPAQAALMRTSDDALPVFVTHVVPAGMRGLVIAAILSAVFTSLASGMVSVAACSQVDFLERLRKVPLTRKASVRTARGLTLLGGAAIIIGALFVKQLGQHSNIIQILNIVMYPFSGVLLGMFLLGMLTTRANGNGVLIGAICGFVATIAVPLSTVSLNLILRTGIQISQPIVEGLTYLNGISDFYYGALGAVLTVVIGYISSLPFRSPSPADLIGLSHAAPAPPHE
jgi:SSS family transporter